MLNLITRATLIAILAGLLQLVILSPASAAAPVGRVDNISSPAPGQVALSGIANDPDDLNRQVEIQVNVGANYSVNIGLADDLYPPDGYYGFNATIPVDQAGNLPYAVYALDLQGGPATIIGQGRITVADPPPETTITSAPETATTDDLIHVQFSSDEPNSTFQCRWDQEPWFDCAGGTAVKLTVGNHRIAVRAIDSAGNVDPDPAVWVITVTQGATTPTNPGTETGRSIVAKAVKKKSRLRINVGPDSATTNYRVIIQRKVGKKWRKVTRTRTRGPKDTVTINLKRGKYRAVLPKSSADPALRSNTVRLKR